MPYIMKEFRPPFDVVIDSFPMEELNIEVVHTLVLELSRAYADAHGGNYAAYNRVVGVLTCASLEFARITETLLTGDMGVDLEELGDGAISQVQMEAVSRFIDAMPLASMVAGDLNYVITKLMHRITLEHAEERREVIIEVLLMTLSDVVYDLYVETIAPYEETKIAANGPVSELGQP